MNSVGKGKTSNTASSVRKQIQYLILSTLIEDEDYESTGINVDNL